MSTVATELDDYTSEGVYPPINPVSNKLKRNAPTVSCRLRTTDPR